MKQVILALGPAGTYGHEAAVVASKILAHQGEMQIEFCTGNTEILTRALRENCYGVAPVSNSSAGLVSEVVRDFWLTRKGDEVFPLQVIGEIDVPVTHCLLARKEVKNLSEITEVHSHSQALAQCALHLKGLDIQVTIPESSTALAAQKVGNGAAPIHVGALASRFAAEVYGLQILKEDMIDFTANSTRFHILGHVEMEETGQDKTAIMFRLPNKPRALLNVLWAIGGEDINMSSIHSIPLGTKDEFAFYCEFDCHQKNLHGQNILARMRTFTSQIIILGSYPRMLQPKKQEAK